MSREDRLALLNSEVYQELEQAERIKQAQTTQQTVDKAVGDAVKSPQVSQQVGQAVADGVKKIMNSDDDGEMESVHDELKGHLSNLSDHELFEMAKMFQVEVDARGLNTADFEKEFEDEEEEESPEDEMDEETDMEAVLAFVKSSLTKLAYRAADKGNTEAAYLIERTIQKIS